MDRPWLRRGGVPMSEREIGWGCVVTLLLLVVAVVAFL